MHSADALLIRSGLSCPQLFSIFRQPGCSCWFPSSIRRNALWKFLKAPPHLRPSGTNSAFLLQKQTEPSDISPIGMLQPCMRVSGVEAVAKAQNYVVYPSAIQSLTQGSRDACMLYWELVIPTKGTSRSYLDDGVDQRKAPALLAQLCICFHEGLQLLWERRSHRQQVIAGISTRRD